MADVNGYGTSLLAFVGFASESDSNLAGNAPTSPTSFAIVEPINPFHARLTPAITWFYQMECTDALNTRTTTWLVQGAPDWLAVTAAATAAIAAASLNTPVRQIRITSQWPTPFNG